MDILFRTFLDFSFSFPLIDLDHFIYLSLSLLVILSFRFCFTLFVTCLRFCVGILFRTFLDFLFLTLPFVVLSSYTLPVFCLYSFWIFFLFWEDLRIHFSSPSVFGHRSYHKFTFLFSLRFWSQILS